jgi:L-fuconolactonase
MRSGYLAVAVALGLLSGVHAPAEEPAMRIDAHIHLFDPTRPEGVPWPPPHAAALYRPHLPADFHAAATGAGITHAIVVEASPWVADNDWLLDLIADRPEFLGVVGNLDPRTQGFAEELERLSRRPKFLGIRPRLQPVPDLADSDVAGNLALLARHGLTLEFNVPQYQVGLVAGFAGAHPTLRIVINHLAGARLRGDRLDPQWRVDLGAFRDLPNTYCKLSAFFASAGKRPAPVEPEHYSGILDAVLDVFGHERVFFGSNWPVSKLGGDYGPLPRIVESYLRERDPEAIEAVFSGNALRAYGLVLAEGQVVRASRPRGD